MAIQGDDQFLISDDLEGCADGAASQLVGLACSHRAGSPSTRTPPPRSVSQLASTGPRPAVRTTAGRNGRALLESDCDMSLSGGQDLGMAPIMLAPCT